MTPEAAQIAAIKLLGWIVGTDDLCGLFLGATGASPDDLKARAGDPEFLASLIEFVMMHQFVWRRACSTGDHELQKVILKRTAWV